MTDKTAPKTDKNLRDSIRTGFFANKTASKLVELSSGGTVEVRQPTVGEQIAYGQLEKTEDRVLRMFTDHVFMPGTDERVFDVTDYEVLKSLPSAGDYNTILEALTAVMNVGQGVADARKN